MYMLDIDKKLAYPNRSLQSYCEKLLFAPVGDRLFCDCLDKKPGFCGNIDFIHKMNIPQLFTVKCSTNPDYVAAQTMWYPSRLTMHYDDKKITFDEVKMITSNDIAFSAQTWENHSHKDIILELSVDSSVCQVEQRNGYIWLQMPEERNTIQVGAAIKWDASTDNKITVKPGETVSFTVAAAACDLTLEGEEPAINRLNEFFAKNLTSEQYVDENAREFEKFFETLPKFDSSDEVINKTWFYRWYILRHNTSKPRHGFLQNTTVYEGRGHKTSKNEPLKVSGWEFSRLICLSSPLQLTDYKWCPDKELLHDIVRGVFAQENEDGIIESAFTHHRGSPFANFIVWAVYQMYLVDGDKEFIKEMIPLMKKCVDGNTAVYGAKNDHLQIEVKHQRTGKEFQPSYWYFSDFPQNGKDKSKIIPMKRMDTSVYHYLNTLGLARMMKEVDDENYSYYEQFAGELAKDINEKTWDEETGFYYDLHHETDEKAMVKNIVGLYPYWAELSDDDKLRGMDYLFDENYFNTGAVFATTAKDCVAYSPFGAWMGFMRSRNSCMWNGPSWPYTNGIMIDAIGKQSKKHDHQFDKQFAEFLRKYSLEHYKSHDISYPYLVEQYHAVTDEAISDEPDYNHSYYLELIMAHVAGVTLREDKVIIDPVDIGLDYFKLDNLNIRGKNVAVHYAKDEDTATEENIQTGLTVFVDGNTAAHSDKLSKLEINI